MPLDTSRAIPIGSQPELDAWFRDHAASEGDVVIRIHNKASGRQTINLDGLQEVATCWGWVDTMTKRIGEERFAVRFVPRRRRSTWSQGNRDLAHRLISEGRMQPAGFASLPADFGAPAGGPTGRGSYAPPRRSS
jgi:uncharacterized protein YdeI (YjbR/CyaY-like superfamily)